MKIKSSGRAAHTTVSRRSSGAGLVINQGGAHILLTPAEWLELQHAGTALLATPTDEQRAMMQRNQCPK